MSGAASELMALAKRLTAAQKKALLMLPTDDRWHGSYGIIYRATGRHASRMECSAMTRDFSAIPALVEKSPRMAGSLGGTGIRLTPLGQQVAEYLRAHARAITERTDP